MLAGMGLGASLLGAAGATAQTGAASTVRSDAGAASTASTTTGASPTTAGRGGSEHSAATGVSDGRPIIARSSAETYASVMPDPSNPDVQSVLAGVGASQLEFFDDLERQSLVCHDDALHACLLLGAGINATTFEQRTQMASRLGWISPTFDRPAREAATLGEISRMLCRMMGKPESITQEESLRLISGLDHTGAASSAGAAGGGVSHAGGLPSQLKPYQGLTGSQLITILGTVHDAIAPRRASGTAASAAASTAAPAPTTTESLGEPEVVVVRPEPALQPEAGGAAHASSAVDEVIAELTGQAAQAPAVAASSPVSAPPPSSAPVAAPTPAPQASAVVLNPDQARVETTPSDATVDTSTAPEPVAQETAVPAPASIAPVSIAPVPSESRTSTAASTEPAAATKTETPGNEPAIDPARFSQFRPGKPVKRPSSR